MLLDFLGLNNSIKKLDKIIVWIYFLSIIADVYFSYVDFGPYPPRNYLVAFNAVLIFIRFQGQLKTLSWGEWFLLLCQPLLILPTFFYFLIFQQSSDFIFYMKPLLKFFLICINSLFIMRLISLEQFLKTILIILIPNFCVGLFQGLGIDIAWDLRRSISDYDTRHITGRPLGLSYYTIAFSEQILIAGFGLLYLSLRDKRWIIFIPLIVFNLLFNHTRSVIVSLSLFYVMGFIFFYFPQKRRYLLLGTIISSLFAFQGLNLAFKAFSYKPTYVYGTKKLGHTKTKAKNDNDKEHSRTIEIGRDIKFSENFSSKQRGVGVRIYLNIASLRMIPHFLPFGMGENYRYYPKYSVHYFPDWDIPGKEKASEILSAHNFLINMILQYGIFGLLVILLFTWKIYRTASLQIDLNRRRFILFSFFFMCLNSTTHNAGFLNQPIFIFFFVALASLKNEKLS